MYQLDDHSLLELARSRQHDLLEAARNDRLLRIDGPNRHSALAGWAADARCWVERGWLRSRQVIATQLRQTWPGAIAGPYDRTPDCSQTSTRHRA